MSRVTYLVDGFNLYHSLRDVERQYGRSAKWLDLKSLCESYLHDIRRIVGELTSLGSIHYFSAPPTHLSNPDKLKRHQLYMRCLRRTGVQVQLQRFKETHKNATSAVTHG